MDIET